MELDKNNSVFRNGRRIASRLTVMEVKPLIREDAKEYGPLTEYTVIRSGKHPFKASGRVVNGRIRWLPSN